MGLDNDTYIQTWIKAQNYIGLNETFYTWAYLDSND